MASSVSCGPALLMDGPTYDATVWRTFGVAASYLSDSSANLLGGVLPAGGQLAVTPGSGLSINVATGFCLVPSSSGNLDGGYQFGLLTPATLPLTTADPTYPRVDLVCATVIDAGNDTSNTVVQVIDGTPAPAPAAPALPADSIPIAQVTVPANANGLVSGNIASTAQLTVAQGGILPISIGSAPAGYTGMYGHDPSTGRLFHNAPTGPAQPVVLPYTPVLVTATSGVTYTGSLTTVLTLTFSSDGKTDWRLWAKWPGVKINSGGTRGFSVEMRLYLDNALLDTSYTGNYADDGVLRGGGEMTHFTTGQLGDTPSDGEHTLTWSFIQHYALSGNVNVAGNPGQVLMMRAEPVTL